MQATTMPDIKELENGVPDTATQPEEVAQPKEVASSAELTTAPQQQLDRLNSETPKQPK